METEKTKSSLIEALRFTSFPHLPEELKENELWAVAIVKVLKRNMSDEYIVAKHTFNEGKEGISILKDCGTLIPYLKVLSIHPTQIVENVPEFKTNKAIIEFLCKSLGAEEKDFQGFTKERLMNGVYKVLLNHHFK